VLLPELSTLKVVLISAGKFKRSHRDSRMKARSTPSSLRYPLSDTEAHISGVISSKPLMMLSSLNEKLITKFT
jgi:hypothetical protein